MKKIIITGVTGQDGSYMVDYLLDNTDCEIFGMIRRCSKPDYSNLKLSLNNPRFKFVVGDL
jgi:GDPmannose 4,6-dehydratase